VAIHTKGTLKEFAATAICGNDITSSCLYVSALSVVYAGKWAWLSLLMVSVVLYFYRAIYAEVVGALPLNGGAYNALLNTTSKSIASMAACLTLLSYMATAVISANEAMHYLNTLVDGLPVIPATIALLAFFMILTSTGLGESSKVAMGIFILHIATLTILLVFGALYLLQHGPQVFLNNWNAPHEDSIAIALFFGFSAAMLGISGFESSANFVEEQAEGVFAKTLKNMWIAVTVFNPLIAVLALGLMPIAQISSNKETLLSHVGDIAAGNWLGFAIAVDATLVLSGAVLTSFVGVAGLIHRMVLDRCLPQFLLKTNSRGAHYRSIILFFILNVSVLLATQGHLTALAGVYTLSFLAVMVLFGIGNLLLKIRRSGIRRPVSASWFGVIFGIVAISLGLVGNIIMNPVYVGLFLEYFIPAGIIVLVMLHRIAILSACLYVLRSISERLASLTETLTCSIQNQIASINSQQIVFFTRAGDLANLNLAMLYVRQNEHTNRMKIVTVVEDPSKVSPDLAADIRFLDRAYPEIDIEFVVHQGTFGPDTIQELSAKWSIPPNFMFIGSPQNDFKYSLADLGGVRLII